ncbi:MAG: extracellular solute-binding protein [Eubacterium sp.]|nr:extracellular solute-binding protein [Eubacterium sp.]
MRKKLLTVLFGACFCFMLSGCGNIGDDKLVLRIANCEEYIDEGYWGEDEIIELESGDIFSEDSLIDDFEIWYGETYGEEIEVEYSTYGTNEELYNQMSLGNVFDLVCPSDYMIMKLMEEERLEPLSEEFFDESNPENYYINGVSPYIEGVFESLERNGESLSIYSAGYMWGTMGLVYNPEILSESDVAHWSVLLDSDYYKRITMKDGVRDSFFVAQCIANEEKVMQEDYLSDPLYYQNLSALLNDTSKEAVDVAEDILSEMRKNAYSLETDSGKADMITGKVVANMQWSGDAVYTLDQAEEDGCLLNYSVPEECTNLWFDGWVMMKNGISEDTRKKQAAEAFLNYISMPENVVRNMYYIGYTSAISGGESDVIKEYLEYMYGAEEGDEVAEYDLSYFFGQDYVLECSKEQTKRQLLAQYPTEEIIERAVVMNCFDEEANERIMQMWTNIRCFDLF